MNWKRYFEVWVRKSYYRNCENVLMYFICQKTGTRPTHLVWPGHVKVKRRSYTVENMIFRFCAPKIHILDTATSSVWLLVLEISTNDNLGAWPIPDKVTWYLGNELNMFSGFSDPENPILDIKITSLRSIVPEKNELVWFVGHLERHLEYLETARVGEVTPSFFLKQVISGRDWHPWHICIISQPTGQVF